MEVGISQPVGTRWFRQAGGMAPSHLARTSGLLSGRYLAFAEREEIALWRAQGLGVWEVARRLGRSASTVSRELRRNAATRSGNLDHLASTAQWHAERAACRPKQAKLAANPALREYVQDRLAGAVVAPGGLAAPGPVVPWKGRRHGRRQSRRWAMAWSPQQIAERLRIDFPDDSTMRVSHEAIYQALYVQGRGALKRELTACLRKGRALRVPRARMRGRASRLSLRKFSSASAPQKWKTGRCRATAREISSSASTVQPSAPWESARRGSPWCCTCRRCRATATSSARRMALHWLGTALRRCATRSRARSRLCRNSCAVG
jgi:DNA-binding CsgD family transcriptional regulator